MFAVDCCAFGSVFGVLYCLDLSFVLGFCREVWLLFCVGEKWKKVGFFQVFLGFAFGYVPFLFAGSMVVGIFGLVMIEIRER